MICQNAFSRQVKTIPLILILQLSLAQLWAASEIYLTEIQIPEDLYTENGTILKKGKSHLKLLLENGSHSLVFMKSEEIIAIVKGKETQKTSLKGIIPLVGTHYLQPEKIPIGTAEERQLSKTGRPQYLDDNRNWEISLRVYRDSQNEKVHFIFQRKEDWGHWLHFDFQLFSSDPILDR